MSDPQYFLSNHCFACRAQGYWIILDTEADRYFCMEHSDLCQIGDQLHGWNHRQGLAHSAAPTDENASSLIRSLVSKKIIGTDRHIGKPFLETNYLECLESIKLDESDSGTNISPRTLLLFLLACIKVDTRLRRKALSRSLGTMRARRTRLESPSISHDLVSASKVIAAFRMLRPFYPRPYLCLFESLALYEFLSFYGFLPNVVFGVIADPFQAHCWVQDGSTVLNDELERLRRYKPILHI